MKIRIGCDVGAKGGIVALSENGSLQLAPTPRTKNEIDIPKLKNILWDYSGGINSNGEFKNDVLICIEDVHSIFGTSAKSNFAFGRNLGLLEGIVSALELPYVKISPKVWQEVAFTGIPKIFKKGNGKLNKKGEEIKRIDTKAMAAVAVKRLFPSTSFLATSRSKVEHDGIIDACLMAYYLKVKY